MASLNLNVTVEMNGLAEAMRILAEIKEATKTDPWLRRYTEDIVGEGGLFEVTSEPGKIGLSIRPAKTLLDLCRAIEEANA